MIGNSFIYLAFSSTIQKLFLGNCWYISRDEIISRCSNNFRFSFKELGLLGRACQVERSKRTVCVCLRPGGLDLIQHGLNWESRSWHGYKVSLDCWEIIGILKKFVSTAEKHQSRSRFVLILSTPNTRSISVNQDWEIIQDLQIMVILDSLSEYQSRKSQYLLRL